MTNQPTLARLRGLLEVTRLARAETDAAEALRAAAGVISELVGFETVAVNLHRPAWDDFEVVVVHGCEAARDALLGQITAPAFWTTLLDERFAHGDAYLIPHGALDWDGEATYVAPTPASTDPDAWHSEDALLVPLRRSSGELIGILSVDGPASGRRPRREDLELLTTIAAHAADAVEAAQQGAASARHGRALEELMRVSARLGERTTAEILQDVSDAIQSALGFRHVVVEVADLDENRYRPRAAAGARADFGELELDVTIAELDRAFDPAFELEGCFLLPRPEALARVGAQPNSFASMLNGRGGRAWERHWLLVPLVDRTGRRTGFIWVDDPGDRLLPSRDTLQALRLFADLAQQALASAAQVAELHEANEARRTLIDTSPAGIVVLDAGARVTSWNPAAKAIFGHADEEVLGHAPPWIDDLDGYRERFSANLTQARTDAVFRNRRADGTEIDVATSSAPILGPDGKATGVIAAITDISAQELAKRDLARQNAELEALHETTLDLVDRLDHAGVLQAVVARAAELLGTEHGYLDLAEPGGERMRLAVGLGIFDGDVGISIRPGEDFGGRIWETERPLAVDDYGSWEGRLSTHESSGVRAMAGVPLRSGGAVIGVLALAFTDGSRVFDEADVALLNRFGQLASLALENARLYAAAREASEETRAIIAAAPLAIVSLSREGLVRSWNRAAEEIYGWTAEEMVDAPPRWVPAERRPEFERAMRAVLAGDSVASEVVRTRKDGRELDVSLSVAPMRGEDGSVVGVMSAMADITERKRAERDLARRNAELEALHRTTLALIDRSDECSVLETVANQADELLGGAGGYVYLVDEEADVLRCAFGSGAFAPFADSTLARGQGISGRIWAEERIVAVDDYATWDGRVEKFENIGFRGIAGVPLRAESRVVGVLGVGFSDPERRFGDAELALLDRFGHLASLALENARLYEAAQRELAERRAAEEALRHSQALYRKVVETSQDLISLIDLDTNVLFASPSHHAILGYSEEEMLSLNGLELVHPDDLDSARDEISRCIAGETAVSFRARVRHRDGRWVSMEGTPALVRDDSGEPEMLLAIFQDITDRLAQEQERGRLEEELRQSQKLEAVGRLAGGIAHDFNNLITAITGYGELALAKLEPDAPVRRHVEEMRRAGERAADLTRQLLAYSRRQVLQPKVLDLNSVVSGLEPMLTRLLGEHVELTTALAGDLGRTRADPGQVEQVVVNLAINARDAMPRGGRLTIRTHNVELRDESAAKHIGATPGDYVVLSVDDTGEGMDRETLERVFEPFFTTKAAGEGTGLGLSTVYGIVTQSGGSIWPYSEPGRGTTFKVYLPRVWDAAAAAEERPTTSARGGSETILLVEDEEIVRTLVQEMLESSGYTVLAAADGVEALDVVRDRGDEIDVLLTDVVMPRMSGQELAVEVMKARPGVRILFASGYTEQAIANHGVLSPGTAFLEKPFTAGELGSTLRELLDGRLAA